MKFHDVRRLAYLTSQYPASSHTFIVREVEALRARGWQIDTFSVRSPSPEEVSSGRDQTESDQTYYILSRGAAALVGAQLWGLTKSPGGFISSLRLALRHRPPGLRGLVLALAHFIEALLLARELHKRKIVHLHNHFANSAATVGLLATRFLRIGWSFTIHGISETDYPAGLLLGEKVEAADFVASVSWFGRAQALRLVRREHWQKVDVVRCGLPLDRLPSRGQRGGDTIICVGRLSPEKGQAGLLQAFAQIARDRPTLKLRLVGDGPDRRPLEELANNLEIGTHVTFCGRLSEDETLAEIAAADVLALPSLMEGLPIVLLEAMALGVPVIASGVAGIPELVEDGRNGLLFGPSKWDALAEGIDRLLSDQSLYQSCAEMAEIKIRAEFNVALSAQRLAKLFETSAGAGERDQRAPTADRSVPRE